MDKDKQIIDVDVTLIDFLLILKKRFIFIVSGALLCIAVATLIGFVLPRQWEADAIILPSKLLVQTVTGRLEEIVLVDAKQIVGQINQGAYNALLAAEINLERSDLPKIRAEILKDTNLIRIVLRGRDAELCKQALGILIQFIKTEVDGKADIEIRSRDAEIKAVEIEIVRITEENKVIQKKIAVLAARRAAIENELFSTKKRREELESEQKLILKKENRGEGESLGMLLYSNEIQLSLRYLDTLNELLGSKKLDEETMNLSARNNEQLIQQKENEIARLKEIKGRIDYTAIKKSPTPSTGPVYPPKKMFVIAGFVLGLLGFVLIAFFLEYWELSKTKGSSEKRI
jgi:LPS O-antigen subunit length determinant protein (WzzB/FepE family)